MEIVKRVLVVLLALQLSGCTAMSTVMALPSSLFDSAIYLVRGEEASFPVDMKRMLAASQQGLDVISMPANIVQSNSEGYLIRFGESPYSGTMELRRETATLSSCYVKVRKGVGRMEAIEQLLLEEIRKQTNGLQHEAAFDADGYARLFSHPDNKSESIGWLRTAWQQSDAHPAEVTGWFKVTSSGHLAYFFKN